MVYAALAGRWVLALLFLAAGLSKLGRRDWLVGVVARYEIVPTRYDRMVALMLPRLELGIGLVLALGVVPGASGWFASALLLGFALIVGVNLLRGRSFDCGCGGGVERPIGWPLVVRNACLAAVGGLVASGPAGLAIWAGPLSGGSVPASGRELLPIPLIVIAVSGTWRCVQATLPTISFGAAEDARLEASSER